MRAEGLMPFYIQNYNGTQVEDFATVKVRQTHGGFCYRPL